MTLRYCKVINNDTKEVSVGLGTNIDFYKSIGYEEKEIIEVNNRYYLKDYAPKEDINKTIENKKQELLNTLKNNIETHIYNYYPRYRQDNIAIYGTEEERKRFKIFKECNTTIYHIVVEDINKAKSIEELNKINIKNIFENAENIKKKTIINNKKKKMSKDFKIYNKWVKLSDLIEVQEDTDYYIQNKGQNTVFGLKTDKEPDDSIKNEGTALYPGMQGKYTHKVGFDLYLKIDNEINSIYSTINITNEI